MHRVVLVEVSLDDFDAKYGDISDGVVYPASWLDTELAKDLRLAIGLESHGASWQA